MKKYIRKNIYRWHRVTSLVIALPLLLWTVSGFLHPVMNSFKPQVKMHALPVKAIDTSAIKVSLAAALQQNHMDVVANFRLVQMGNAYYYQVQATGANAPVYVSCHTGQMLHNGDALYAEYLAQQFLNGAENNEASPVKRKNEHFHFTVKEQTVKAGITETKKVTRFDEEYKRSQKILPVYKVSFDRKDAIRLYVSTETDKLVYAVDRRKAAFSKFFSLAHSWSFLAHWGKAKSILIGSFSFLCLLSSLFGFYIYNLMPKKKSIKTKGGWAKHTHRIGGNIFLITTLLYAFSGSWHAFKKVPQQEPEYKLEANCFANSELDFTWATITKGLPQPAAISNVSVVHMYGNDYWQVSCITGHKKVERKYKHFSTGQWLADGDLLYGNYIANQQSGNSSSQVSGIQQVTHFNHTYSMMNKRLPVVQTNYSNGESWFVETATGAVAARVRPADKAERFSFSNLHMHHYADMWAPKGAGKAVRNTVLISTTLGLLLVALTGIIIYIKKRLL